MSTDTTLVTDLTTRAKQLQVNVNDLPSALYRAELVHAACMLELLFTEGQLSEPDEQQLRSLGTDLLKAEHASDSDKVKHLLELGKQFLSVRGIDKNSSSALAKRLWRQETAVDWMARAKAPWTEGRESVPPVRTIDVEVKTSSANFPMDSSDPIKFVKQPENYTTAVMIWNLLKQQKGPFKGLGPCLHLYEARSATKWFPAAHHSMPLKSLYTDEKDKHPFLYAVDEDEEYLVATILAKQSKRDVGVRQKGIILRLNTQTLADAAKAANLDPQELTFQLHSSRFWVPSKTLPFDTDIKAQRGAVIAFSSDYYIIKYSSGSKDGSQDEQQGSVRKRLWRKVTGR